MLLLLMLPAILIDLYLDNLNTFWQELQDNFKLQFKKFSARAIKVYESIKSCLVPGSPQ